MERQGFSQGFSQEKNSRYRWLVACGLGIPVGLAVGHAVGFAIGYATGLSKLWAIGEFLIGPGITGMIVGITQWLGLRGQRLRADRWIMTTSISWATGHTVTSVVGDAVYGVVNLALWQTVNLATVWLMSGLVSGLVGGAIGGVVVGLAQTWAFRGQGLSRQRWILVTSLSWAIGHAVIEIVDFMAIGTMGLVLSWMIYGVVYGRVTSQAITCAAQNTGEQESCRGH
jgi:hypothetical protein